jgi:hypothetical protein
MPVAVQAVSNGKTRVRIEYIAEMGLAEKKIAVRIFLRGVLE